MDDAAVLRLSAEEVLEEASKIAAEARALLTTAAECAERATRIVDTAVTLLRAVQADHYELV